MKPAPVYYRIADLMQLFGVSRATLDRNFRTRSDFPRPVPVAGAPRWLKAEIDSWWTKQARFRLQVAS